MSSARLRTHTTALLGAGLLALLSACSTVGDRIRGSASDLGEPGPGLPAAAIDDQLAAAEADLEAGAAWAAARRTAALRRAVALDPDQRDEVEALLEVALETSAAATDDPDIFDAFEDEGLPRRARAILAVGEARALLDRDRPYDSFRVLRGFQARFPGHHLRSEAAGLIYRSGIELANRTGGWWIFDSSVNAPLVLEYLVLNHPSYPSCPEAYIALADWYLDHDNPESAIARLEDLLLYHPQSPDVVRAEAQIPRLRLALHLRDDYDRRSLERARDEFRGWLARYADTGVDPEQLAAVERDLADCLGRLVRNDLIVARFYKRVDKPYGARLHALRAVSTARDGGLDGTYVSDGQDLVRWADDSLAAIEESGE